MIKQRGLTIFFIVFVQIVVIAFAGARWASSAVLSPPEEAPLTLQAHRLFGTSNLGIVEIDPNTGSVLRFFSAPVNQGVSDGLAYGSIGKCSTVEL
jgi:hypothetical protein